MIHQKQWVERKDSIPGYVYLMQAIGYHGLIPGLVLSRVKIGLNRNPQKRLDDFHSNQPPCDVQIIRTIFVEDMTSVEEALHEQFKKSKVKLNRSREWFDLNPLQFWQVQQAFNHYEKPQTIRLPSRFVVASVIALLGTSLLLHSAASQSTPIKATHSSKTTTLTAPELLHKIKRTPGRIKSAY